MELIHANLTDVVERTSSVKSWRFKLEKPLKFKAGQFLRVIFDTENMSNSNLNKFLSFSCAPDKDYIEFTKRLSNSEFSKRLLKLKPNDRISLEAPMGNCVLSENDKKIAFLIGGIGITPVISIIEHVVEKKLPINVTLIYSNRSEDDIAFKSELNIWARNSNIDILHTITDCTPKEENCLRGLITKELIENKIPDYRSRAIFIFGPPIMVSSIKNICLELNCNADMIRAENFVGY
ncbi:MAG: FAD-dependent oxidoreductase [Candidatus Omnitrophica bacterium]|nr:FAD-dependent oxidoreductase [Candidatus Omnitrophota bacterium]